MSSHELWVWLIEATLASSAAIALVLALRMPMRRVFGAQMAYATWLLVPVSWLALLLPARVELISLPVPASVLGQPAMVAAASSQYETGR